MRDVITLFEIVVTSV